MIKYCGFILALTLGCSAFAAPSVHTQRDYYRYQYIPLPRDIVAPGYGEFLPIAVDDKGRVYGKVNGPSPNFIYSLAVYDHGTVKILQPGFWIFDGLAKVIVNARGTIGGHYEGQAALFRNNRLELIPFLPGDKSSLVVSLNDSDAALVYYETSTYQHGFRLYQNGRIVFTYQFPEDGGQNMYWSVNNQGTVYGGAYDPKLDLWYSMYFRKPYGEPEYLNPVAETYICGITTAGNIVGNYNNYTGIWDKKGNFHTYAEDSCWYFNDKNLIVSMGETDIHLIASPGVKLNMADLLVNPEDVDISINNYMEIIQDINNNGDMVGFGAYDQASGSFPTFLLKRLPPKGR